MCYYWNINVPTDLSVVENTDNPRSVFVCTPFMKCSKILSLIYSFELKVASLSLEKVVIGIHSG